MCWKCIRAAVIGLNVMAPCSPTWLCWTVSPSRVLLLFSISSSLKAKSSFMAAKSVLEKVSLKQLRYWTLAKYFIILWNGMVLYWNEIKVWCFKKFFVFYHRVFFQILTRCWDIILLWNSMVQHLPYWSWEKFSLFYETVWYDIELKSKFGALKIFCFFRIVLFKILTRCWDIILLWNSMVWHWLFRAWAKYFIILWNGMVLYWNEIKVWSFKKFFLFFAV